VSLLIFNTPSKAVFDETVMKVLKRQGFLRKQWEIPSIGFNLPTFMLNKYFIITIFIIIILAIVIALIIKSKKSFKRKTKIKEIMGEKIEETTTPYSLKKKAKQHEGKGEFRYAIRFYFIALLLLMHENKVLYLDETKTNKEIINYLANNNFKFIPQMSFIIDYFNFYWYGYKICDQEIYKGWEKTLESIWNEIEQREKKVNKNLIFSTCLIVMISFFITACSGSPLSPLYSVRNKGNYGYSVFFVTLNELGYPVKRTTIPIEEHNHNSIQIVKDNYNLDINDEKIKEWVEDGGVIVYLTSYDSEGIEYGVCFDTDVYSYGQGFIICKDASIITNGNMVKSTDEAYELIEQIDRYSYEIIYFNEYHLYSNKKVNENSENNTRIRLPDSFWKYIPRTIKIIIFQLILVVIGYFWLKGKHFGKTIPLYEEIERTENEYLFSVAYLYNKAKCTDLILDIYYRSLIKKIPIGYDDWLKYWKEEGLPSYSQAKRICNLMENRKGNLTKNEFISCIHTIEKLKKILDKRRDLYWKTLKSD